MQTPTKLNLPLDQTTPVACEECGNDTFLQVLFLRKASRFLTHTDQDVLVPAPTFACADCGHVNEEFQLADLNK